MKGNVCILLCFVILLSIGALPSYTYAESTVVAQTEQVSNRPSPLLNPVVWQEDLDVIELFIERGANVNARDEMGLTPIMYAARSNTNPAVFPLLVNKGADVNAQDREGKTALMYAARFNPNPRVIHDLIEQGAEVNAEDDLGFTAMVYAHLYNDNKDVIISLLMQAGADSNDYVEIDRVVNLFASYLLSGKIDEATKLFSLTTLQNVAYQKRLEALYNEMKENANRIGISITRHFTDIWTMIDENKAVNNRGNIIIHLIRSEQSSWLIHYIRFSSGHSTTPNSFLPSIYR